MAASTFPLYDQILNGRLRDILVKYRSEGLGLRGIASRLGEDHGVMVSHTTVGVWCVEQDIPKPDPKAAA